LVRAWSGRQILPFQFFFMVYGAPTMVSAIANPAFEAFMTELGSELVFGEILLRKNAGGFQLCHVQDREVAELREAELTELRQLAQFTSANEFRPLKSAPTLRRDWRFVTANSSDVEMALQMVYPGAVADWFAARQPGPPVTHYRDFTSRQSGMYRITATLTDVQAARVARAGCDRQFCLKQRWWTVEGLEPDRPEAKSVIPCLEPCAVLLEFARTAARLEQRATPVMLAPDEVEVVVAALEQRNGKPSATKEADFSVPENPRRVQLILEKLTSAFVTQDEYKNG
jgi:hypothetical protein